MNRRKVLIAAIALGIAGSAAGVTLAHDEDPRATLVSRIAQRFNLNEPDVQAVVDEVHREQMAHRVEHRSERLDQAVEDGTITAEQKQLILDKWEELRAEHDAKREQFRSMTPDERRQAFKAERDELEVWANEHDIELKHLVGVMKPGLRGGWKHR